LDGSIENAMNSISGKFTKKMKSRNQKTKKLSSKTLKAFTYNGRDG